MKKIVCVLMILMLISGCLPINALEGVVTTFIDFEGTSVPDIFTRRGGAVRIVPGMAADGIGNACFMQWGSIYYINDGNSWVNTDAIYFNADVRAEEGANFICFSTQRYAGNSAFITLNDGDILVGTKKVGSYICDKWYEVTAILDRSTDTIDVWFDGEKLADDTEINFIHEDSNSYIAFSTQNSSASVYIDDITISNSIPEIPETDTFRIDAELYGISEITHSSPMKILLDLRGVQKSIQNAELCVVLSGSELGADFEIFSGNNAVTKRSLNANGRILYIDMTDYVTAGKINEFTLKPCSEAVIFSSSENAYMTVKTDSVASALISADFESQMLDEVYTDFERAQEENVVLADNPEGIGKVMKVTLNNSDALVSGAKRSETVLHSVGGIGMHMWYTFDTYLPEDYVEDGLDIITQWHVYPDDQLGENWRSPVLGLKISGGYFALSTRWDKRPLTDDVFGSELAGADDNITLGRLKTGEWINWTFEINWSTEDDGFIRVWRNGTARLSRTGPNIYNDQEKLNLKQGFYKPDGYDETNLTDKREIYFDNLGIYHDSEVLKDTLPKSMHTAALIQNHEKTDNGITLKLAFKNLMSKPVNAKAVYEIADKTDGETCLRVSEKITPGDTNQKTITIYYPDIPVDYTLNAYLTDSGDTVISNISSTEPIYFCRSYDFEDFVNSESGMPEHLMKNGYSAAAYDSSSGGNYLSILSSGSKNGFSLVNAGGENMMSKKILLSAKVRVPDNTECSFFNFNEYSSTSTYGLTFTDYNEIMYGDLYLGRYENYQWHSVALLLDTTLQTADVFLDGDLIADNLNWNWIPYTYIHMYAQSLSSDTKTYTGVDDFMITDNPAYFPQNANDLSGIKVQSLTVSDSEGTSSTTGKSEKTISAKASNTASEPRNAELIAAVYEGNTFKKVSITPIENLNAGKSAVYDTAVTLENDNQNLKAFVWNSLSQMKPAHKH